MTAQRIQMGRKQSKSIRFIHEMACSVNLSLALTNCFFALGSSPATNPFFNMDRAISRYLGLLPALTHPKDEFTPGYFAFFVPASVLAICIWLLLRLFARSNLTRQFLRSGAGIAALIGTPVSWLCLMWASSSRYGWNPLMAIEFYRSLADPYLWGRVPFQELVPPGLRCRRRSRVALRILVLGIRTTFLVRSIRWPTRSRCRVIRWRGVGFLRAAVDTESACS